jgi:hypothetical protein
VFPGYHVAEIFVLIKTTNLQAGRKNVRSSKRIDECMKSPLGIEKCFGIREAFSVE